MLRHYYTHVCSWRPIRRGDDLPAEPADLPPPVGHRVARPQPHPRRHRQHRQERPQVLPQQQGTAGGVRVRF